MRDINHAAFESGTEETAKPCAANKVTPHGIKKNRVRVLRGIFKPAFTATLSTGQARDRRVHKIGRRLLQCARRTAAITHVPTHKPSNLKHIPNLLNLKRSPVRGDVLFSKYNKIKLDNADALPVPAATDVSETLR